MSQRRTCRACGCWELAACEGGCSWLSADRCSACPDAPLTLPINEAHLFATRWVSQMSIDLSGGRVRQVGQSAEFPTVICRFTADAAGVVTERSLFVGVFEVPDADPARAAELLNMAEATR